MKDYDSFTSIEKSAIKKLQKTKIELGPVPPDTDEWKILHKFDKYYPQGFVASHYINWSDRLVYEYDPVTNELCYTNCRGHKYRGKSYAEMSHELNPILLSIKEQCRTHGQRLAFNQLLNSFKFK